MLQWRLLRREVNDLQPCRRVDARQGMFLFPSADSSYSNVCGYGPTYCGDGCQSNCDAVAECGQYASPAGKTCPLNVCCSEFGFCGKFVWVKLILAVILHVEQQLLRNLQEQPPTFAGRGANPIVVLPTDPAVQVMFVTESSATMNLGQTPRNRADR